MIPIGYMAKLIESKPDWLKTDAVKDIISVSNCISKDFTDWIEYWAHNGYWFFNSPEVIISLASEHKIDLAETRWFYFEAFEKEFHENSREWKLFKPEEDFPTDISAPKDKKFMGYDIVTFSCGSSSEHSPLSCNHLADEVDINTNCLLNSLHEAIKVVEGEVFHGVEPGPYRIFSVFEVSQPELPKHTPLDPSSSAHKNPLRKTILNLFTRG